MDWTCWTQAFSAMYEDPSDAKRAVKELHLAVSTTRLIVAHEAPDRPAQGGNTAGAPAASDGWNP